METNKTRIISLPEEVFDTLIEEIFKKGVDWSETYSGWFIPNEEDHQKRINVAKQVAYKIIENSKYDK